MRLSLRSVTAALGAVALVGTMAIGAATPTHAASGPSVVAGAVPGAVPNTNIILSRTSHKAIFHPKTLSGVHITTGSCTLSSAGMTVNNETTVSQTVTYNGSPFFTALPESTWGICFPATGTYTFGLSSNTHATLTVTVS